LVIFRMKHLQQLVEVKILNGKYPIECKIIFFVLNLIHMILFRNLFKGMEKIHMEIFDQVNFSFR
jgi:hypothetical protein